MSPHGFHNLASHTERVGTSRGRGSEMQREKEGCSGVLCGSEFPAPSPAPRKSGVLSRVAHVQGGREGGELSGSRGVQRGALVVLEGQEGCGSRGVCGGGGGPRGSAGVLSRWGQWESVQGRGGRGATGGVAVGRRHSAGL